MANQNASNQPGNFPMGDLCYDLITVVHQKSKALEAYDKYLDDAQNDNEIRQLLEQIRQQDTEQVQQLKQHLGRLLGQQSGSTNSQSAGQSGGGL